jgi:uncharacterized protein (DUF1499 family)
MNVARTLTLGGLVLAIGCALGAMLAGLGSRWDWWQFRVGFQILTWAAYGGLAASILSLSGLAMALHSRWRLGHLLACIGLVLGLGVVAVPWHFKQTAQRVPPIHDITTDTDNPPAFVAILALRQNSPNPAAYGGPEVAAQQQAAYPDLKPLVPGVPPDVAFDKALAAAREMGWDIVDAKPAEGRIEATDTTFWFGFKDDVVIRISPTSEGSRIDVRSVSRVGRSDIGTNAKRIRAYLEKLKAWSASVGV